MSDDAAVVATGHLARRELRHSRYPSSRRGYSGGGGSDRRGASRPRRGNGNGVLASRAATLVGPGGFVVGVDISGGMLVEAKKKAEAAGLRNVAFSIGDAEALDLPVGSFDRVASASALVPMSDISHALRHWRRFLKPGGIIAFDTPARPFGLSGIIAEVAADHGVDLGTAQVADTEDKCRSLLEGAGFEVVAIRREVADTGAVALGKAIAFWDGRLGHLAWCALTQAAATTREAIRRGYIERVTAAAIDGLVRNDTALNFTFGRKPFDQT